MSGPDSGILGVALASGQLVATLFAPDNPTRGCTRHVDLSDGSPNGVVAAIVDAADRLVYDADRRGAPSRFTSVGVSLGGHIDHAHGVVVYASDLIVDSESWRNEELGPDLARALEVPAAIENDVNCMVEYQRQFGVGRNHDCFVVVYLAPDVKGLGSGILIDGGIVRGATGGAGEFGHVVVEAGGPRCYCGNRGCLQALLNTETLVRNVNWGQRAAVRDLPGAARLAERDDRRAVETFQQAGRFFGQALSVLVNVLNPPLLILGGPEELLGPATRPRSMQRRERPLPRARPKKARSAALFTQAYNKTLREYSFCELEQDCRIEISELTLETAAIGAAMLASVPDRELVTAAA